MQVDLNAASVLSALNRADAVTETRALVQQQAKADGARLATEERTAAQTGATPSPVSQTEGTPAFGLSAVSVTVAQAAPELDTGGDGTEDGASETAAAVQETGEQAEEDAAAAEGEEQQQADGEEEQEQVQTEEEEGPDGLTDTERAEVRELSRTDAEVRRHEAAHAAVGGRFAGAPTFTQVRGPDGQQYAVAGEVSIDSSPVPGNPEATIEKLEQVRRAALAPADPSAVDRRVASQASQALQQARVEADTQAREERQAEQERAQEARDERQEAADRNAEPPPVVAQQQSDAQQGVGVQTPDAIGQATAPAEAANDGVPDAAASAARSAQADPSGARADASTDGSVGGANATDGTSGRADATAAGNAEFAAFAQSAANDGALRAADRPQSADRPDATGATTATDDGRAALQRALFDQEPQTRTLLGQRAFEDAIRIRDTVNADTDSRAERRDAEQAQATADGSDRVETDRALTAQDLQTRLADDDVGTDARDRNEASAVNSALISGQRAGDGDQSADSLQRVFA